MKKVYFITGSQDLYGEECLLDVAKDSKTIAKYLDKKISLEISDLYIFYIKILVSIQDDNDLLAYIDRKVKQHVLEFVTDYNKTK